MTDKKLQKYYSRVATEGKLKALLWGGAVGFGALAILGGLYWLMAWKSVWICLVVWAVITVGTALALYQWKFKPTTKYIAHRVDNLGLHERILTMTELEGDESYMAQRQRRDALEALETIGPELIKIGVSKRTVITTAISTVIGVGLATLACLSALGIIRSGQELLNPDGPNGPLVKYTITYGIYDGLGEIQGETEQVVVAGQSTQGVAAIAAEGWAFLRWTDAKDTPYREDVATGHTTYLAVFVEVPAGVVGNLADNEPDDAPGEQANENGDPSEDAEQGNEAKGKYEEINQIIDGKTFYGDLYKEAYDEAMEELAGEAFEEDEKDIVGG